MRNFLSLLFMVFALLAPSIVLAADETNTIEDLLTSDNANNGIATNPQPLPTLNQVTVGIIKDNATPTKKLDIGKTGFPLPRFVSLKRDKVNVRKGPNETFDIAWTYTRKNLPIEIISEYDNWRKIRDHLGAEGWIFHSLLSGSRYALVNPWKQGGFFTIHSEKSEATKIVAKLETGTLGQISDCDGDWCKITIDTYQGFIKQEFLWGIYLGDVVK